MSTIGCTKTYITRNQNDNLKTINQELQKQQLKIPDSFLKKCQWFKSIDNPTQQSLAQTSIENHKRYVECYYLHNNLVEYLLEINNAK